MTVAIGDPDTGFGAETIVAGTTGARTEENPAGQNIAVNLHESSFDGSVAAGLTAAHEGSHVADGSEWVSSGFSQATNPTLYATELRAYRTELNLVGTGMMSQFPWATFVVGGKPLVVGANWSRDLTTFQLNRVLSAGYGVYLIARSRLFYRNTRITK